MNLKALQKQDAKLKRMNTHKNYDEVANKVAKLLSATAQTFIPELCDALAKDWYPKNSHEQIKQSKEARDEIRDKILQDWSYDVSVLNGHNIWSEVTIKMHFPDWLRNPTQQDSQAEAMELAHEANRSKNMRKRIISEHEKQNIAEIATKLPDTVIIPEPREKNPNVVDDEEWERSAPSSKYLEVGEKGHTVMEQLQEIRGGAFRLFAGLTEKSRFPSPHNEDLIIDYIKPTREFRRNLVLEMEEESRIRLYNDLGAVDAAVQDMLEIIEQNKDKK